MKKKKNHKLLSNNIKLLGKILGEVLHEQEGKEFFEIVEIFRLNARKSRKKNNTPNKSLLKNLNKLDNTQILKLSKAFTEFLRLSNLAEQVQRIREKRSIYKNKKIQPDSIEELFIKLKNKKISPEKLQDLFDNDIQIELVFTAHPTEILLPKSIALYQLIAKLLIRLDQNDLMPWEHYEIYGSIKRKIFLLWKANPLRAQKPTPLEESKVGLEFTHKILWKALPNFKKHLCSTFKKTFGKELELNHEIFTFASWMGGDRDGNPHVICSMTEKIIANSTQTAINLYRGEINKILESIKSTDLEKALEYLENFENDLNNNKNLRKYSNEEFIKYLNNAQNNCTKNKEKVWSDVPIQDLKTRAQSFGLSLLKIDLRENSIEHEKIVQKYFQKENIDYLKLSSKQKTELLFQKCQEKKLTLPNEFKDIDNLNSMKLRNKFPDNFFNSYIISMSEEPQHILEVYFLYKLIQIDNPLQVVPLFETPESLENAPKILVKLFSNKWYRELISNKQEIMIGYSDSGKRSGRFHASWSLNKAQVEILKIAEKYNIDLHFFHGRGGSIARGGGPIRHAMLSLAGPLTTPKIRITEQGESIRDKFGLPQIAERTLELYFTGFLESNLINKKYTPKFKEFMEENTKITHKEYSNFLTKSQHFIDYYNHATPVEEISLLNVGSRPSRRKKTQTLDDLRAIPWVFSWTQNRALLPAWLSCEALPTDKKNLELLQNYYKKSEFFRANIDLNSMTLAKTDIEIFKMYTENLVPNKEEYSKITSEITEKYKLSCDIIKKITKSKTFLSQNPILRKSIQLRNPYVDVLNILQVHSLALYRKNPNESNKNNLAISIAGIAAGMRNSG